MKLFVNAGLAILAAFLVISPAQAQIVIKLAHDQPETSTHHQAALKWKELVESRTSRKRNADGRADTSRSN
jgi:TRAP-type C4-dicarboxylate transport system substrate-binding protein